VGRINGVEVTCEPAHHSESLCPPSCIGARWQRGPVECQLGRDDVGTAMFGVGDEIGEQEAGSGEFEAE
jgi:hypothetical protein